MKRVNSCKEAFWESMGVPSRSKNGLREQRKEMSMVFLWFGGGARVRAPMHSLNFQPVPQKTAPRLSDHLAQM